MIYNDIVLLCAILSLLFRKGKRVKFVLVFISSVQARAGLRNWQQLLVLPRLPKHLSKAVTTESTRPFQFSVQNQQDHKQLKLLLLFQPRITYVRVSQGVDIKIDVGVFYFVSKRGTSSAKCGRLALAKLPFGGRLPITGNCSRLLQNRDLVGSTHKSTRGTTHPFKTLFRLDLFNIPRRHYPHLILILPWIYPQTLL